MRIVAIAALSLIACDSIVCADPDLDRLPPAAEQRPDASSPVTNNLYVQSDLTLSALRDNLIVPLPPPTPPRWEARLFLDARLNWELSDDLGFTYSGRFNLRSENGIPFPNHEDIRNDLREVYFTWQSGNSFFLELGRINLKSGVAEGFNPTDYFKTRAVVEPTSADPTVLREDRLGSAMLLAQAVWSAGSLTFAFAPKLASLSPPYLNPNLPSFDPMFDRTNARARVMVKASVDLFEDVNPEFLFYDERGRPRLGLNVTKGFGQAIVGYLEWSGGNRADLAYDAFTDGVRNAVLPPSPPIPVSNMRSFANDLAIGASYSTKIGINFDLEYDVHQAGFSSAEWRNWFNATQSSSDPLLPGELWFIRGYAADQQEPMARNSLFLRADWQNAFVRNLTLTGFIDSDLHDGSDLVQFTADYYLSRQWTVGALADIYCGGRRSDFGSLPQSATVLAKITRYF
jgi:hypothetical protein